MAENIRRHTATHNHHYSFIMKMMSSLVTKGKVIILVEGGDDKPVYESLFIPSAVFIQPAPEENGARGCQFVESVTKDILATKPAALLLGIRDADYTPWSSYVAPPNVFRTEERDMEMMLLRSTKVRQDLDIVKQGATAKFEWIKDNIGVPRGKMRLLNSVLDLQCNFSDNARISNLWENNRLRQDWSTFITSNFISNCVGQYCNRKFNAKDYNTEVSVRHLNNIDWYKICQGHDVMYALVYELADSRFNVESFMKQMIKSYRISDFHDTQLYSKLHQFCHSKGWHILK